ncbi:MBL fold metallo-hydrolase [Streptomyces sp. OR43]|uniref:MBL fold metallo-hydrolase n=1 Tax=Streptomyces sp. or43 TaxID=2478957 RepID=UPI0011CDE952|nr:MBL fold metallo-hydrolase [Streptomyces sp. or43]TXS39170.1 MBL fold metallo-hydrolase [Streptomyces sp. or43]
MSAPSLAPAEPTLREIADGVYAFEQPPGGWCLNNAGLITGGGRAVLVDTAATERRARRLQAEVERIAPGGPDVVVNTHFHGDHVFGNSLFSPRAVIVAHEGTRSDMAEAGLGLRGLWPDVAWGDLELVVPDLTFRDSLVLRAGDLTVELIQVGPAHTADDVVAWIPERRVLFTGDVAWSGVTPFVLMGSVRGSLHALERLRRLGPLTVVAGHGRVGGPEVLDATETYLRRLDRLAREGIAAGVPALEAARSADPEEFGAMIDSERLVGNLHRAYAELRGLAPGARIDVAASMREMFEFNGGPPQCHA